MRITETMLRALDAMIDRDGRVRAAYSVASVTERSGLSKHTVAKMLPRLMKERLLSATAWHDPRTYMVEEQSEHFNYVSMALDAYRRQKGGIYGRP